MDSYEKQQEYEQKCKDNATALSKELDKLEHGHSSNSSANNKEFWEHVKLTNELFKGLKPMASSDWQALKDRQQEIIDKIKTRQEENRYKQDLASKEKRETVLAIIREANGWLINGNTQEDFDKARDLLQKAMSYMKTGWDQTSIPEQTSQSITVNDVRLNREDQQFCWEEYSQVSDNLRYKIDEIRDLNFESFKSEALELAGDMISENAKEIKQSIRDLQNRIKVEFLNKEQRSELRDILNNTYDKANALLEVKWKEGQQKHEEWEVRMHEKLHEWHEKKVSAENFVRKQERLIEQHNFRLNEATNETFRIMVVGWITEAQNMIDSANERIKSYEERISSVREKLKS